MSNVLTRLRSENAKHGLVNPQVRRFARQEIKLRKIINACVDKHWNSNMVTTIYWVKFHIIPEMTSQTISVVKFEIKISRYFENKALS